MNRFGAAKGIVHVAGGRSNVAMGLLKTDVYGCPVLSNRCSGKKIKVGVLLLLFCFVLQAPFLEVFFIGYHFFMSRYAMLVMIL